MLTISPLLGVLLWLAATNAHIAPYHRAMYCFNGNVTGVINQNTNTAVQPLFNLTIEDFWFQHHTNCDQFPPPNDTFLELPAGGSFEVELVANRAFSTYSYDGKYTSNWADGGNYPDDYNVPTCIVQPNMHTQNQSMAAGTAFAISYEPDIKDVTPDNLAVFTVRYHTPWNRITSYDVPADLPACGPNGCTCAWLWSPNGCGQENVYMAGSKCKVVNATSTVPVAPARPPVWCEEDPNQCTQGAKQMIIWHQLTGNNIEVDGDDLSGHPKVPGYNMKLGFKDGAQHDIFADSATSASNKRDWQDEGLSSHRRNNVRRLSDHDGHW